MDNVFFNVLEEDILESNYYELVEIKGNRFSNLQISTKEIILFCQNSDFFKEKMRNFRTEYLYNSEMHGIAHNIRVAMLSYYIACYLKLGFREQELVVDASFYHDIGRVNDIDDVFHGDRSAEIIENIVQKKDDEYMRQLKAIIVCHSHEDEEMEDIIGKYNISMDDTKVLASLLKDTDALDRIRFYGLDPNYLRLEISYSLLNASAGLFFTYQNWFDKTGKDNLLK